jgi:hypothetical protein
MKPRPFSWTHYDEFNTCPRQFHAKRIAKSVVEPPSEHLAWGNYVHKQFELRQTNNKQPLPDDLKEHEPFMQKLDSLAGQGFAERKIGLSLSLKPCGFFDKDVWYRGAIDHLQLMPKMAIVTDYKTGKPHSKFGQLKFNALHTFIAHPQVEAVKAQYYWTTSLSTTDTLITRDQMCGIWQEFMPNLRALMEAYKTDFWPAKQNGLCRRHCPVTSCEFNGSSAMLRLANSTE